MNQKIESTINPFIPKLKTEGQLRKTSKQTPLNISVYQTRLFVKNIKYEVVLGLLGIIRDVFFLLIKLMYYRNDDNIRNLVGISQKSVGWISHPHFFYARKGPTPNLHKQLIPNQNFEIPTYFDTVNINTTSITFKLNFKIGSMFMNLLIKKMILECTLKVEFAKMTFPFICIGTSSPYQIEKAKGSCVGCHGCGAGIFLWVSFAKMMCNGKGSHFLKEGGIRNGDVVTAVVNQMNNNKNSSGGKMNFILKGKKIFHTIINVPSEGVYLGFGGEKSSFVFHILSFCKLCVPSPPLMIAVAKTSVSVNNDNGGGSGVVRYVGYDFYGNFDDESFNYKDEEGKEIFNIKEYYK